MDGPNVYRAQDVLQSPILAYCVQFCPRYLILLQYWSVIEALSPLNFFPLRHFGTFLGGGSGMWFRGFIYNETQTITPLHVCTGLRLWPGEHRSISFALRPNMYHMTVMRFFRAVIPSQWIIGINANNIKWLNEKETMSERPFIFAFTCFTCLKWITVATNCTVA